MSCHSYNRWKHIHIMLILVPVHICINFNNDKWGKLPIQKKNVFYMLTAPVVRKLFWSDMCANTICVESTCISYISINIIDTLVSKLNVCWIYLERALSFLSSKTLSWASRYTWYAAPKLFLSNLLQRSASSKQASENLKKKWKSYQWSAIS